MKYAPDPFALHPEAIAPASVPKRTLHNGLVLPTIGLGTFGSDRFSPDEIAAAVKGAIARGYRLIDCASVYGNQKQIGQALREVFESGLVKREDLVIMSKIWNDRHHDGDVLVDCAETLRDLGLDFLDVYFVHWPFPNFHPPGCDVDSRSPDARPFFVEEFMGVWRQMERLVDMGLVRSLGTSNVTKAKMEAIWPLARVKPALNEMEIHPHFQQPELFDYMTQLGIQTVGFCPLGSPMRPDRDKTESDTVDIEDPVIVEIAKAHGVHPAIVCLKWSMQRGTIPIPFSIHDKNYTANLAASASIPLSDAEMNAIAGIDKGCRLIKGQVFLWPGATSWENLWDEDGTIDRSGWNEKG